MTNREFFPARHKAEDPVFQNVLRALPVDRMDCKPHEKSPSAQRLVLDAVYGPSADTRGQ